MQNSSKNLLKVNNPVQIQKRETMSGATTEAPHKHAIVEAKLSLQTPLADYKQLIKQKLQIDEIVPDEVLEANFDKISAAVRDAVWKLLFSKQPTTAEDQKTASELLQEHKRDVCFYAPWDYNKWIVTVRDELLKRGMLDFWREQVVKHELGPCWARDSDYFDDMEDPEVEAFYNQGGCVAPFGGDDTAEPSAEAPLSPAAAPLSPRATISDEDIANFTPNIVPETALEDYRKLVNERVSVDHHVDEELLQDNYRKIADAMRKCIWGMLFPKEAATKAQQEQAAKLLEELKQDECFYSPWEYNTWIVRVRDELLKRGMLEFWREQIVKHELGPCWAKDSDYFDDLEDPEPEAFYRHAGCVAPFAKQS